MGWGYLPGNLSVYTDTSAVVNLRTTTITPWSGGVPLTVSAYSSGQTVNILNVNGSGGSGVILFNVMAGGNVGIGTAAPNGLLDVEGTVQHFYVDTSGNVGIGTWIPGRALYVKGTTTVQGNFYVSNGSNTVLMIPGSIDTMQTSNWGDTLLLKTYTSSGVGNNQLMLYGNGNVGINTTGSNVGIG